MQRFFLILFILIFINSNAQYRRNSINIQQSSQTVLKATAPITNLLNEVYYFSSKLLPIASKDSLQYYLDTYNSVRLEAGDYSGTAITLSSNQSLYGSGSITTIPEVTIEEGSTNVYLEKVSTNMGYITFESGNPITNCTFKTIENSRITCTNALIEDNEFINLATVPLTLDCSVSGYFRNNRFTRHKIHSWSPQIVLKGNDVTPSYGNIHLWINLLTPHGLGAQIDNLDDLTWVGLDSESWNWNNEASTNSNVEMTNMGRVSLSIFSGGNNISYKTPSFNISADDVIFTESSQVSGSSNNKINSTNGTFVSKIESEDYDFTGLGFNLKLNNNGFNAKLNDLDITTEITDTATKAAITNTILGNQYTPIAKPSFEVLPNPTGINWSDERIGKTDSKSYIQGLIDANGIVNLPEGIYYIGSTLTLNDGDAILGAGTGKTIIVGLTDDFPLITLTEFNTNGEEQNFAADVTNLTLQGGSDGIRLTKSGTGSVMWVGCNFKFIIFRDNTYGIHVDKIYGLDNNFFEELYFINNDIGFYQDYGENYIATTTDDMSYIDKTVFYKCKWVNNTLALSLISDRGSNLNAWVDCGFDGNTKVANIKNYNYSFFANCIFNNTTGTTQIISGDSGFNFYSCLFENNNTSATLNLYTVIMEGCDVLDSVPLQDSITSVLYLSNSTLNGSLGAFSNGIFSNSSFANQTSLNKLLVYYSNGVATTIIDTPSTPYPQLLVKQ